MERLRHWFPRYTRSMVKVIERKLRKNFKVKKLLVCGIYPNEYNRISACESTKEIWDYLRTTHERTSQVKKSKVDMLTSQYKAFIIKKSETIQYMHTRLASITNKLCFLGEVIVLRKQVRKILRVLPKLWESNVDTNIEAQDLKNLTMDKLIENLKTYELKRQQDKNKKEPKNKKTLTLKDSKPNSRLENDDVALLAQRFIRDMNKK